jgi:hypothetical protein
MLVELSHRALPSPELPVRERFMSVSPIDSKAGPCRATDHPDYVGPRKDGKLGHRPGYEKREPTFSDAIAEVRRLFWEKTLFAQPRFRQAMQIKKPPA